MSSRPWIPLVAALLAAGAGFMAFRQTHAPEPGLRPVAEAPAPTTVEAGAGSDAPANLPVPEEVPALKLADLRGQPRPLRGSEGRPRLFNFWATWCAPCRKEIPLLNTLAGRYRADRLEVVGIAIDFQDSVAAFLKKVPMSYDTLVGEEDGLEAARRFGMGMALPFSVFADGQNHVVAVKLGELHADEIEAILGRMREVRAGHQTLAQARAAIAEDLKALSVKRAQQS
jgi:thiol-disulfide isomerase/thioredoxin